ncbi:MAG: Hpt domain-containing protein [Acidobacteriota bacterium]|nr:Hpt domain-containing protein [Acidobacteriota bacterium]
MFPNDKLNVDAFRAGAPEVFRAAVDLAVLADFEKIQLDGEPDLIVELIDLYLEDAPRRVGVMRESLAKKNWLSVKREAHSLRGSSGNLGAFQVALICDEIEVIEYEDPSPSFEAIISCLEQELERVLETFLAERQRRMQ